jgi:hypothetical protein
MAIRSLGRKYHTQQSHYMTTLINYNDADASTGRLLGYLPPGSVLLRIYTVIQTAFNAGTTNTLSVGKTLTGTDYVSATAAGSATGPTAATVSAANTYIPTTGDQAVYASYAQSGTAATAGVALVVVEYVPVQ